MKAFTPSVALLLPVLGALLGVSGCSSIAKEPTVEVNHTRNPHAPARERKTYVLACTNPLVQEWFVSNRKALLALDAALGKLGYEEATDPTEATYEIVAQLGFGNRPSVPPNENPDSIRYQNVAAMVGQGRYRQILTERGDSGGSLLVGPDGQLIPTGSWKKVMEDTQEREREPAGSHDMLILRAWDLNRDAAQGGKIMAWEVAVRRTIDYRRPSPEHVGILIRHAAEHLETGAPSEADAAPDGG